MGSHTHTWLSAGMVDPSSVEYHVIFKYVVLFCSQCGETMKKAVRNA